MREVLDIVSNVVGFDVDPIDSPRRSGDPASLVADPSRIATELGWEAKHDVREMIRSSWAARNG